ncbi:hypothetical protein BCR32DRAFT_281127 [Anaeromyces robustus]|jgi:hypothetical protein|uniref:Uncharacterized protein n=1 Tax=Anaeromyces robustus TaxID=1754192 RepID=A0A1Y1X1S0_9FUNG|nr:hypothetical protein BCR32DRAFT_281127 [Anaeromyces robustus]|eukprot:ORX79749.1 hypothetical protein BCR32DRAFT_281127 [Anaeromyces robustus]
MNYNSDTQAISQTLSLFIDRVVSTRGLEKPSLEVLKSYLISLKDGFIPKLAVIEHKICSNPTFSQMCRSVNVPKKYGFLGLLALTLFSASTYTRFLWSKRPRLLTDVFALAGPGVACTKLIYSESLSSAALDEEEYSSNNYLNNYTNGANKEVVSNKDKYKFWVIYWLFYGVFHISDNMVSASTQKYYRKHGHKARNPYWYYWLLKVIAVYWAGYNDGNVTLYQKAVIPLLRKYHEMTIKKQN